MLPLIAVLLPTLLVFLGFAVDLAYMQATRMELRAASDSAARAGATALSQTDSKSAARQTARDVAVQMNVAGEPLRLRNSEVQIGRSTRDGSGKWTFVVNGTPANAVRVTAQRNAGSRDGPVRLFFGSLIGVQNFQPVQSSTASFLNVDICLVLDRSSSMKLDVDEEDHGLSTADERFCRAPRSASRWKALDNAVKLFLGELDRNAAVEHVALVTYSSELTGVLASACGASRDPATLDSSLTPDLPTIEAHMNRLMGDVWNGNTYIESGMATGLAALQDRTHARTTAEKVMIVLTDGHQNIGDAMTVARACPAAGVTVHAITFGDGADRTLMRNVAAATGGQHYHADNQGELIQVFRDLAAQTARLTQ